jgi:hypothetical protein
MGLWLRKAVWQYVIRAPTRLRSVLGRSHVNRSLRTSNYHDAIWTAHWVALKSSRSAMRLAGLRK